MLGVGNKCINPKLLRVSTLLTLCMVFLSWGGNKLWKLEQMWFWVRVWVGNLKTGDDYHLGHAGPLNDQRTGD